MAGLSYDGYGCAGRGSLLDGFVALEFARTDPAFRTRHEGLARGLAAYLHAAATANAARATPPGAPT